jgi:hypothetical protein
MPPQTAYSPHTFHIPVMGTGFTIDTPLKVARYGISSVISVVDDVLIEQMRKFHCDRVREPYEAIADKEEDSRARRITAYLNLIGRLVERQMEELRASRFEPGSEITRYYDLLPETPLKQRYRDMLALRDGEEKKKIQDDLRGRAVPGSIDVNIMTKLDREAFRQGVKLPPEYSDGSAAMRGFAKSNLKSSVVLSAGLNQRLYAYANQFADFLPDDNGTLRKHIILKVSDYRSAAIQGKFLAKKGLWVSEFRIESGLNCGGHAFATKGYLIGPILEEFKVKRGELIAELHEIYCKGLTAAGRAPVAAPLPARITFQGGIGTAAEDELMLRYYQVDGTGWATPFLLVPEVTNVDEATLEKLCVATDEDVYLSDSSPLGVPFWNLRTSASEDERRRRLAEGTPGSACPKNFLASNNEFTSNALCLGSHAYQKRKLEHLPEEGYTAEQLPLVQELVLGKSCLCRDLAGGAVIKDGIDPEATPAICPGPNIVNFSRIATLEEMVGHIYGRLSILANPDRPHMFIRELMLYVDYLRKEAEKHSVGLSLHPPQYFSEFAETLLAGVEYYRLVAAQFVEDKQNRFLEELKVLRARIESTTVAASAPVGAV